MKRTLLSILLVCAIIAAASHTARAQRPQRRVQLGVRAGILSQDIELDRRGFRTTVDQGGTSVQYADDYTTDSRLGFHVAVASRIRITHIGTGALEMGLFFQPEVIYSQHNYKIMHTARSTVGVADSYTRIDGKVSKIRIQSVEIPTLVSFKLSLLRAQVGPVFNVMFRTSTRSGDIRMTEPIRPLVGWTVGASVDIVAGLVIDGRYTGQFKDLKSRITAGSGEGQVVYDDVRGSLTNWSIGLSYMF